jgi:hypothetical protein
MQSGILEPERGELLCRVEYWNPSMQSRILEPERGELLCRVEYWNPRKVNCYEGGNS